MKTEKSNPLPYNRGSDVEEAEMVYRESRGSLDVVSWERVNEYEIAIAEVKKEAVRTMLSNALYSYEKWGRAADLEFVASCLGMSIETLAEIVGDREENHLDRCFVNPVEIASILGYPEIAYQVWGRSGKDQVAG